MGVTLERVQNKFACIIGELCSEPDVLSQFAIWLDLRLAEYKAKGAISLDCSGDHPNPTWLRGFKPHRSKPSHDRLSPRDPTMDSPRSRLQHEPHLASTDRLSPDVVVVKEEVGESGDDVGVFPISLHRHEELGNSRTPARKRTATESVSSEHNLSQLDSNFYQQHGSSVVASSPKVRKMISSSESDTPPLILEPVSNQSLMSIISGDLQDENSDTIDFSTTDFTTIAGNDGQGGDNSVLISPPGTSNMIGLSSLQSTGETVGTSNSANAVIGHHVDVGVDCSGGQGRVPMPRHGKQGRGTYVLRRMPNVRDKPKSSVRHIVSAVSGLERWLWNSKPEISGRFIEDIPPKELDGYLSEFFSVVQKSEGEDYGPSSFKSVRSCIDRFLKDVNYPCSISRSAEFSKSQESYKRRVEDLKGRNSIVSDTFVDG